MLKAARAQGMPMMVSAMMMAARSQAAAIQNPPKTIQRMLKKRLTGFMSRQRSSGPDVAELAAEVELARGDVGLEPGEPRLEVAELELQRVEAAIGRHRHLAPQRFLLGR